MWFGYKDFDWILQFAGIGVFLCTGAGAYAEWISDCIVMDWCWEWV